MKRGVYVAVMALCLAIPWGASAESENRFVLFLWSGLRWEHILSAPEWLHERPLGGAVLNLRPAYGARSLSAITLSLASGGRAPEIGAVAVGHVDERYSSHLNFGAAYELHTGRKAGNALMVSPDFPAIERSLRQITYPFLPGLLGSVLNQHGLILSAYGNSDTDTLHQRPAALMAADSAGTVARGRVDSSVLRFDSRYPFGLASDYFGLLTDISLDSSSIMVIDLGDPYRLDQYTAHLDVERRRELDQIISTAGWQFIETVVTELLVETDGWMLLSPYPGEEAVASGFWLAPMITGFGGPAPSPGFGGLSASSTTRWPGLTTNTDLAPTVLEFISLEPPPGLAGSPLQFTNGKETLPLLRDLAALQQRLHTTASRRSIVLRSLIGFQVLLYGFILLLLAIGHRLPIGLIKAGRFLLLLSLSFPALLLLQSGSGWFVFVYLGVAVLWLVRCRHALSAVSAIACFTVALVIWDMLSGYTLIRFSYLGYDAVAGARFYGLGNEYMGIFVGSAIIGWTSVRQLWLPGVGFLPDLAFFLFCTAVIGMPFWGANAGGAITATMGFGGVFLMLRRGRIRTGKVVGVLLATGAILAAIAIWDGFGPNAHTPSHIGQAARLVQQEGIGAAGGIIQRKLEMNLRLFRYSIWSRGLIAGALAMGLSLVWPTTFGQWLAKHQPLVSRGIIGTLFAGLVAAIVNDSGVVAAATCVFFAASTMLYLALSLKHDSLPLDSNV